MRHPTTAQPLSPPVRRLWQTAQWGALVVTAAVLAGLLVWPEATLTIAWFGIVPILPASFMVNAGLWRSVCPIATANMMTGSALGKARLTGRGLRIATTIGIVLLALLVPLRRLVLNQNGPVLAAVLLAIVLAAVASGVRYSMKGGFCNSVCPILPVEKFYGQSPLIFVRNPRCVPCSVCTKPGCFDVDPSRAVFEATRLGRGGRSWIRSPFGLFMAAFPGFIYGYFQTPDLISFEWMTAYSGMFVPALTSLVAFGAAALLFDIPSRIAAPVLAALSVGTYYWFTGPASADAFGLSVETGLALRWMFVAFVSVWLFVALRRSRPTPTSGPVPVRSVEPAVLPNIH